MKQNQQLKDEYEKIVHEQLKDGVIEKTKESSTSERAFYMPHKPVIKENASTNKVRMVFDASVRPHPTANSVNECMHTGPPTPTIVMGHINQSKNVNPSTTRRLAEDVSAGWFEGR